MSSSSKSTDRRRLRLVNLDALSAELDRVEAAERAGQLQAVGNWTPGQILGHVGSWINYGWDGYPMGAPPWFVRWFLRWRLPKMLKGSMPTGVRIPGVEGGTTGIEPVEFNQGMAQMRRGVELLKGIDPPKYHSPAFGEMSMEDRVELNLRHAELHFSFLRYPDDEF